MARLKKHSDLLQLAQYSTVPVISGCCDKYHPCQALADLMTIYEGSGSFKSLTLAYVGIHNNVANSKIVGCVTLGIKLILVTPITNHASWDAELMGAAYQSGYVHKVDHFSDAVAQSDYIYTNTWIDIHPVFEIEETLIESERSIIYQQAENRMHVQKGLLLYLLDKCEDKQIYNAKK